MKYLIDTSRRLIIVRVDPPNTKGKQTRVGQYAQRVEVALKNSTKLGRIYSRIALGSDGTTWYRCFKIRRLLFTQAAVALRMQMPVGPGVTFGPGPHLAAAPS